MNDGLINYSVVIPVYNEEENIRILYTRLKAVLEKLRRPYEIIFVDDGSKDDSSRILEEIALSDLNVRAIFFSANFGQHYAVTAGIRESRGNYVVTLDADLQNPPEEITRLIEKMREGFDMVSGYRKMRKDSFFRRLPSRCTNSVIRMVSGLPMKDYGSMLRIFKRETALKLADTFEKNQGYITMLIAKVTRNVSEIEVRHDQRYGGGSKYNLRKLGSLFVRIFCYYDLFARIVVRKRSQPLYRIGRRIEDGKEVAL